MRSKEEYPGKDTRRPDGIKPDGTPYRVLIVDDSMFVAKQLNQILTSEGYQVMATAQDGLEGLEKYKEFFPNLDLVTMDITMPKMDGLAALQRIMEFDKRARVIMISAMGKQALVKQALVSGARNYIVKPLDRNKVLERFKSVLAK